MRRRTFIRMSAVGSLVAAGRPAALGYGASPGHEVYHQPPGDAPVIDSSDVVVCGGGPAGVAAAIAAARSGARVRLLEVHGFLGGVWTAGMVNNLLDCDNKDGLMKEIRAELTQNDAQVTFRLFDVEFMKLLLETMCLKAGVKLLYHSRVVGAVKNHDHRVTHVLVENKSGRQTYAGQVFIDATGEGDLSALSGCRFSWGHPLTGKTQPMSMIALLGGIEHEKLVEKNFIRRSGGTSAETKRDFRAELERAGIHPSYQQPSLFRIRDDHFAMMSNHEYGFSGIDAQDLTDATIEARQEIHRMVDALRRQGGIWQNIRILATSPYIGVREGRRIAGRYTVTKEDLIRGARFDDAVCRATFSVDVHALDAKHAGGGYSNEGIKAQPYDIPLRALIAQDVDGLLMAGRCISGDFYAHASYRVTGNAVPMGEAAGKLAAVAAQTNRLPHTVDFSEIG